MQAKTPQPRMTQDEAQGYIDNLMQGKTTPFNREERAILEKLRIVVQDSQANQQRMNALIQDMERGKMVIQQLEGQKVALANLLVEFEQERRNATPGPSLVPEIPQGETLPIPMTARQGKAGASPKRVHEMLSQLAGESGEAVVPETVMQQRLEDIAMGEPPIGGDHVVEHKP